MNEVEARDVNIQNVIRLQLVSDMAMKVGFASVIRKKSSSLCLFFPRLRTLK